MGVVGWHSVRVPGGLTDASIELARDVAISLKGHGATQVYLLQVGDDTLRFLDFWPDRASYDRFIVIAEAAMSQDVPMHWDLMHGEYVSGGDGNADILLSLI